MSDPPSNIDNKNGLTFFNRLNDEQSEENEANASGNGYLSSIIGRFWKTERVPPLTSGFSSSAEANAASNGISIDTVTSQLPTVNGYSQQNGNGSSQGGSVQNGHSRMSPSTISQNSIDSDSTSAKKLSKLTSLLKGRRKQSQELKDYNRSNFKDYWMPDSTGRECYQCEERFTAFRRRHHCRLCGQIFCAKCCNIHVPGAQLGYTGDLRLCHYCANMMAQYLPPETDIRQASEEINRNTNDRISSISVVAPLSGAEGVSSDANSTPGGLMWGGPQDLAGTCSTSPVERKNSLSLPPSSYKPPTMLCVQELYAQHENKTQRAERHPSASSSFCEVEEESGPDWFRNMETGQNGSSSGLTKDDRSDASLSVPSNSRDDFDPKPILDMPSLDLTDSKPIEFEAEEGAVKKSSTTVSPISPTKKDTFGLDDNIDKAFDKRTDRMMDYLFRRERINDERWKPIVLSLSRRLASTVRVDVERRKDSMNILNYVHVKKLVVDTQKPSAEPIWGTVCLKSLLSSSMNDELHNASVMIVAGSIEYERIQGKLSSIEPIICQETEFLSKQVDRILSRRPSLLLVEGGVSHVAAQLLRDAGVAVIINVKPSVLHRVARCTGADILPSSDAQLIQQNIGFCPAFRQHTCQLKDGRAKLLLTWSECPPERGCSVLLRGACGRELRAVKRVLQFMTSLLYSSKLEKEYLNMFNTRLAFQISGCDVCETRRENIEHLGEKSEFEAALADSILSLSPFVDYEPPFLETSKGRDCSLLPYFKQPLYRFGCEADFDLRALEEKIEVEKKEKNEAPPTIPSYPRHAFSVQKDADCSPRPLASFRAFGGKMFRKRLDRMRKPEGKTERSRSLDRVRVNDVLCPFVHQRVAVLFGSFSPKSPNAPYFCVRPWVLSMEFYADHDMTIGEFLTKYCFNKSYACPSANCEVPMVDHSRKLVYSRVCVEVTTQIVVANGTSNGDDVTTQTNNGQIIGWHHCPTCKASSPVVTLNTKVWHLSFGKFLDYLANSAFTKGCISSPSQQQCSHCVFHQQTHFFSQGNFVTTFKVTPVRPFDVQFSPVICQIVPQQFSRQALIDGVTRMAALADDVISTARARLDLFVQHDHYTQYAGTFHTVLRQLVDKTQQIVSERRPYADELKLVDRAVIPSNDMYSIKASETLMCIREGIFQLISTWNDQSAVLAATLRAVKKGDEPQGTEIPDIALERIDDPFPSYLHLGLKLQPRVGVVVRDIQDSRGNYKPDIGSVIAYALSTADYEDQRERARASSAAEEVPLNLNSSSFPPDEATSTAEHMEIEFSDTTTSYYVKAYYAERFRMLRKLLFAEGEEAFIRSLSQTNFWKPQGGKSGSFFYRTQDDRFVVKSMSSFEIQSFVKFAPNYFEYIKTAVTEHKLTTLCKVYGVFRVGVKSKTTQLKVDILVMEYLFYKHNVQQVWDLKGSLRNRMASAGKSANDVLLDENLMMDLWNKQLYVYPHSKAALNQAISNDSHFLSAQHVMDYSLLVGVDETNGQLILGIVDYVRTYTLDKKLESWVKIVAIPGAHLPTIISPEMYCTRFSEAIDTYFPVVPDQWTGLGSAVSY